MLVYVSRCSSVVGRVITFVLRSKSGCSACLSAAVSVSVFCWRGPSIVNMGCRSSKTVDTTTKRNLEPEPEAVQELHNEKMPKEVPDASTSGCTAVQGQPEPGPEPSVQYVD